MSVLHSDASQFCMLCFALLCQYSKSSLDIEGEESCAVLAQLQGAECAV